MEHETVYLVAPNDAIIYVNDAWLAFAQANEATHLTREAVLNRPLWDFISDPETQHLHAILLKRIRNDKRIARFPFRCDSPALRRYMEMEMSPSAGGTVEYRCRTRAVAPREPHIAFATTAMTSSGPFLRMCSWCNKVDIGGNTWKELEDAITHLTLFNTSALPTISHTMCDSCFRDLAPEDA